MTNIGAIRRMAIIAGMVTLVLVSRAFFLAMDENPALDNSSDNTSDDASVVLSPTKEPQGSDASTDSSSSIPESNQHQPPRMPESQNPQKRETKPYRALYLPNEYPLNDWYVKKIQLDSMWDYSVGAEETIVAVIDTGFGLDHEDFWKRWYVNEDEQGTTAIGDSCWFGVAEDKQTNNCDDDNNGYVDDWRGWDFDSYDNAPEAGSVAPTSSAAFHGTAVAGLVAATGDNGVGAFGVNWRSRIMPLQALDDYGYGSNDAVREAINYAVTMGADVINMSLGSSEPDALTRDAIQNAINSGVVVVAAAGNDGCACMVYPGNYPEVLSVGASTSTDTRASFSSYGSNLDVVAPGVYGVKSSTWVSGSRNVGYVDDVAGTSIATPIVSGLASVIRGIDSTLTAQEVIDVIINSADKVPSMSGQNFTQQYGYGRINSLAAMQYMGVSLADNVLRPTWPIYRVYTNSPAISYFTTDRDRLEGSLLKGYSYEIAKFINQD